MEEAKAKAKAISWTLGGTVSKGSAESQSDGNRCQEPPGSWRRAGSLGTSEVIGEA